MAIKSDIERYRTNFRAEQEGALLYRELAKAEVNMSGTNAMHPEREACDVD